MVLCISPHCNNPDNSGNSVFCEACGSELLLEGRYRVLKTLGQGGFGKTYEVHEVARTTSNNHSGQMKVLKVLIDTQPKAVELFTREAQVLSQLDHPGIPRVEPDGYFIFWPRDSRTALHCLIMEKVEGLNLSEYMHQRQLRPISEQLTLEWLMQTVNILHAVHQQHFFHRDIKPSNIMLRPDGQLVLIDFGAVRAVTQTYMAKQGVRGITGIHSMGFTPPEQLNGQAVPQSDFFALGRTFVYLLTGKEPAHPDIYDTYNDECQWRQVAPSVSPMLADLIDRLMARLPRDRPANTQVIVQELAHIGQSRHPSKLRSSSPTISGGVPNLSPTYPLSLPLQEEIPPTDIYQPPPIAPNPSGAPNLLEPEQANALKLANRNIKMAWVAGIVLGVLRVFGVLVNLAWPALYSRDLVSAIRRVDDLLWTSLRINGSLWLYLLLNLCLIFSLTYGIHKKNRACAIIILVYYCTSLLLRLTNGNFYGLDIPLSGLLIYCFVQGIQGTFSHYQLTTESPHP